MDESKTPRKEAAFIKYQEALKDPSFRGLPVKEKAQVIGVDQATLWRWRPLIDFERITKESRKAYWEYAPAIDLAVIKKAIKGDVKAAELVYAKYEGWTPKNVHEITRTDTPYRSMTTEQLVGELIRGIGSDAARRILDKLGDIPAERVNTLEPLPASLPPPEWPNAPMDDKP